MKKVRRTGSATKMIKTVNSECFPHSLVSQQSQDFLLTAAHSSPCLSGGEQHQLIKGFLCDCGVKSDKTVCSHDDVADLLRLKGTFASLGSVQPALVPVVLLNLESPVLR